MMPVATPHEAFIALADPSYYQQLDDLQRVLNWDGIDTILVPEEEIIAAVNASYDRSSQGRRIKYFRILMKMIQRHFFQKLKKQRICWMIPVMLRSLSWST